MLNKKKKKKSLITYNRQNNNNYFDSDFSNTRDHFRRNEWIIDCIDKQQWQINMLNQCHTTALQSCLLLLNRKNQTTQKQNSNACFENSNDQHHATFFRDEFESKKNKKHRDYWRIKQINVLPLIFHQTRHFKKMEMKFHSSSSYIFLTS